MEITKLRSQLSLAFKQLAAHLQGAWNTLAREGRGTADRLKEGLRASGNDLRRLQAGFLDVIAVTKPKISKFRSQLSIVLRQLVVHLQGAWSTLARVGRATADKLQEALRASENDLRRLQASFLDAIAVTNAKISKFASQVSIVLQQVAVHFQGAQSALARVGRGTADKLQEARRASENDLRRLQASFLDAIAVTNAKISNFGSQMSIVLRQLAVQLQGAWSRLARFARSVADKPRRIQEARRARENDLRTLLASSLDAVIVTDNDRRFVAANSPALDLFGVSESNMSKFTIGTFLSHGQILDFDRNRSPLIRQDERRGKCKIRRLDGSLRVAECIFVANVVPHRHLYRFLNVGPQKVNQLRSPASYTQGTRKPLDVNPSIAKQVDQTQ